MAKYRVFDKKNLQKFEIGYFASVRAGKQCLRYGQALVNMFDFDRIFGTELFYEEDDQVSRSLAWTKIGELE